MDKELLDMGFKKYFNKDNEYEKPVLIKFDKPVEIKLNKLQEFLDLYKPFSCSDVWGYAIAEVGNFGNYCELIYESIAISPEYSRVYREDQGIYKAGETHFQTVEYTWRYSENKPFWNKPTQRLYTHSYVGHKYIDEVTVDLYGVYVISYKDKEGMEKAQNT